MVRWTLLTFQEPKLSILIIVVKTLQVETVKTLQVEIEMVLEMEMVRDLNSPKQKFRPKKWKDRKK